MADEKQHQNSVHSQCNGNGKMRIGIVHPHIEQNRYAHIHTNTHQRISDGIFALPHDIAQNHSRGVTCKASPSTGHVAITRNEQYVDGNEHHTTNT